MRISDWSSDVCSSDLGFAGKSSLSTWLTRILINEALGRVRANKRRRSRLEDSSVPILDDYREKLMRGSTPPTSPEAAVACGQIRHILEDRSEERRVGKECVRTCRSRGVQDH